MMERGITQHRQEMKTVGSLWPPRAATEMKMPVKLRRATNKLTRRLEESNEIHQKMRAFINRIGGRCITPKEDELRQTLLKMSNNVTQLRDIANQEHTAAYQEFIAAGMKAICDKILRRYGKTTDEEDANICREGKTLIDMAIRSNDKMNNKALRSLIDKTDELMGRCRWIECRPKETNTVGVPARPLEE